MLNMPLTDLLGGKEWDRAEVALAHFEPAQLLCHQY